MTLNEALKRSRIATLRIDEKEYLATHTAAYVRCQKGTKKINNNDIPDSNKWEAMGWLVL